MDRQTVDLVTRGLVEVIRREELDSIEAGKARAYIGFEPSGIPHLGTGLLWPGKIRDLVDAGINTTVLLADWHAMVNDKLGGDMERIHRSGDVLKRVIERRAGEGRVHFVWASDLARDDNYWSLLLSVAKRSSLSRIRRALPIMGRSEEEADRDFSKYIYPLMQVTDIFYMDLDIAMGGMDQRHAHMLARDIAEKMGRKKPISLHGPLLSSLTGSGRMDQFKKMSKSDPESAIFLSDSEEAIRRKISRAYCPQGTVQGNPVTDIARYIILPQAPLRVKTGNGEVEFKRFEDLERSYVQGQIDPRSLKEAVAEALEGQVSRYRDLVPESL
ncbi:tyrosine--tRNA ligase [Thermogymnomonas acidicola]|uniref:Tyrosine--tRNA ligase n=1 Tax=Thermogymnomonas acidicola TaxID=399579 RepID=A0AA37F9V4_9ARCH|nr:tyrosine--tRNA ligase [Thermogymnomonas acidicola]GGM76092.1 tyrosine--tRNA ligase [Thermogymnomonas acidicola]